MALDVLVELLSSLNRVREMRRVIKSILKNGNLAYQYEVYLKANTSFRSAKTIQDYVNPKHSSTVFNTFKHLEVFLTKERDLAYALEPEKLLAFEELNEKLKGVKLLTTNLFKNSEVSSLYELYLLDLGMTALVSKKWSSPDVEWTAWFDSMEHIPVFFSKNEKRLRELLLVEQG